MNEDDLYVGLWVFVIIALVIGLLVGTFLRPPKD